MQILPTSIQEQINRVDRQRSLMIGISAGLLAAWSAFRLFWLLYIAITFGLSRGSLVFQFVLWGMVGTAAAIAAVAFLTRYSKGS
jgi:hypothetical protein